MRFVIIEAVPALRARNGGGTPSCQIAGIGLVQCIFSQQHALHKV